MVKPGLIVKRFGEKSLFTQSHIMSMPLFFFSERKQLFQLDPPEKHWNLLALVTPKNTG